MTILHFLVTIEMPDGPSGRDVLIGRIRENIELFVESEYPDAAVDVQWRIEVEHVKEEI